MISLTEAALHVFERGDFRGQRIGEVACTDEALEYVAYIADRPEQFGIDSIYCEAFVQDRVINAKLQEIRARTRADAKAREEREDE